MPKYDLDLVENGFVRLAMNNLMYNLWKNDTSANQMHSVLKNRILV